MWVLINYMSFVQWLSVGMSIVALLYLRWKRPEMPRPIKFNIMIPISFAIAVLFLLIIPLYQVPKDTGMGLICVLTGIPVYLIGVAWKGKPKIFNRYVRNITRLSQKMMSVANH